MVKLEFDLYYIKHISPALDFYIIFHTLKIMLRSRGSQYAVQFRTASSNPLKERQAAVARSSGSPSSSL